MIWTIDTITNNWYWLVMALFSIVGLLASWRHDKALPALWGVTMSVVLYIGAPALEPILFGFQYYEPYTFEWILTGTFTVCFTLLNASFLYYALKYGHIHEKNTSRKKSNAMTGFISVAAVLMLAMPVAVAGYVQETTVTNVLTVQGSYGTGDQFLINDGAYNTSELFDSVTPATVGDQVLGYDADPDTAFLGYLSTGIYSTRDRVYYGDYITYVGNGSYIVTPEWQDVSYTDFPSVRYMYIPLNITNQELAEFDFVRLHSSITDFGEGVNVGLSFQSDIGQLTDLLTYPIDDDTAVAIVDYSIKSQITSIPDGTVWIVIWGSGDAFDETQTEFTLAVEANTLIPADFAFGYEYSDMTVWIMVMMLLDVIYLAAVVFATPWIDAKIDKSG